MKHPVIFLMLLVNLSMFGQCPTGSVFLLTQQEVDNFIIEYPNCTSLYYLAIGDLGPIYNITNLSGLSNLVSVERLYIMNLQATDLQGLNNLQTVGDLKIYDMPNLITCEGLISLETVTDKFKIGLCTSLTSLNGLETLNSFSGHTFDISYNLNQLTDSSGLDCYFFSEDFRNSVETYNIQPSLYPSIFDRCGIALSTHDINYSIISIYPNPTSTNININSSVILSQIDILSTMGQKVFTQQSPNITEIDVSNLKSGVYFLKLTDDQNNNTLKKFIKE